MMQKWTTVDSNFVINNGWCRVRKDIVKLPNGKIIDDFFVNVRPDIALVLPITVNREIVFVRQYRHGIQEILLELPAGSFDSATEASLAAAQRELKEETGYVAAKFTKLATLYDNPVKDTNQIHLFIAEDATYSGSRMLDETEDIAVVLIPIEEVKNKILRGDICVCGSITAIFLGLDFLATSNIHNLQEHKS